MIDVVILYEMFVHNIKQNKMFISHVFIMFAYEMSSSYSSSEAGLKTKKLCLSVELTIPIHLRRTQLTITPLM